MIDIIRDDIFFYLSKILWNLIIPGNVFVFLLIAAIISLWTKHIRKAKIMLSTIGMLTIFVAIIPLGNIMLYPLEQEFKINPDLPNKIDGIIVLSGAVSAKSTSLLGQVQVNEQIERDLTFMSLAYKYPNAKLLYTGGSSSLTHQQFKGAYAGNKFLKSQRFEIDKVVFESSSRNTYESAVLSKKIINPKKDENWILITTAWHMPRSVGVFKKVGWEVIPYPVDYKTNSGNIYDFNFNFTDKLSRLEVGFKEWLGLLAYSLTNKI